jgi:hypothetical protein
MPLSAMQTKRNLQRFRPFGCHTGKFRPQKRASNRYMKSNIARDAHIAKLQALQAAGLSPAARYDIPKWE